MTRRWVGLFAVTALLAACGDGDANTTDGTADTPSGSTTSTTTTTTTTGGNERIPMVVDTDLAADDIVALMYLAAHPDVDLRAVTVTGAGEVHCPRGAAVARGLLHALDRDDVPVACGRDDPLSGSRAFPDEWRTAADNVYGLPLPVVLEPENAPDAVDVLTSTLRAAEQPVVLLTLGPLTNVAEAMQGDPTLVDHLASVVVMGGAVDVDGNVYLEAQDALHPTEWNMYVDPQAAEAVVSSGAPVILVPLDATNQVPVDQAFVDQLEANNRSIESRYVVDLFAGGQRAPDYLWDPLAAVAATDLQLMSDSDARVTVVVDGAEAGRTARSDGGDPVVIAEPTDPQATFDHLVRVLARIPADEPLVIPTTLPLVGDATLAFDGSSCTYDGPVDVAPGRLTVTLTAGPVDFAGGVAHLTDGSDLGAVLEWANSHPGEQPPEVDAIEVASTDQPPAVITAELLSGTSAVICFDATGSTFLAAMLTVND